MDGFKVERRQRGAFAVRIFVSYVAALLLLCGTAKAATYTAGNATELAAALKSAKSGDLVTLGYGTFTLNSALTINSGVSVVGTGVSGTIITGAGFIIGTGSAYVNIAKLSMENISSNQAGAAIRAVKASPLIISDCKIYNCGFENNNGVGGAVYIEDCEVTVYNSEVSHCHADGGGAFYVYSKSSNTVGAGKLIIENCLIHDNYGHNANVRGGMETNGGGAILVLGSSLQVVSSQLYNNSVLSRGGAICAGGSLVDINDSRLYGNTIPSGTGLGAAIYIYKTTLDIMQTYIDLNEAREQGGGIFLDGGSAVMYMNYCTVALNTSGQAGTQAGIAGHAHGKVVIENSIITSNGNTPDLLNSGPTLSNTIVNNTYYNEQTSGIGTVSPISVVAAEDGKVDVDMATTLTNGQRNPGFNAEGEIAIGAGGAGGGGSKVVRLTVVSNNICRNQLSTLQATFTGHNGSMTFVLYRYIGENMNIKQEVGRYSGKIFTYTITENVPLAIFSVEAQNNGGKYLASSAKLMVLVFPEVGGAGKINHTKNVANN